MVGATCLVETRDWYLVFFSFGLLTKQATLLLCHKVVSKIISTSLGSCYRKNESKLLPIIVAQSAVLGNLLLAQTITDTQIWTDNDVWDRWIWLRITVAEIRESFARNYVVNGGLLAVELEISNSLCRIVLVLEEEQRNVIWLTITPLLAFHRIFGAWKKVCSRATADLLFEMPILLRCCSSQREDQSLCRDWDWLVLAHA